MTKSPHASKLAIIGFSISCVCLLLFGLVIDPLLLKVLGMVSFAIGLYCKIKYKENSFAVWFSLIIGFLVFLMIW